jgi:hypothetical protein
VLGKLPLPLLLLLLLLLLLPPGGLGQHQSQKLFPGEVAKPVRDNSRKSRRQPATSGNNQQQ